MLNARAKEAKFVSSMSNTPKKNKDRKYSSVLFEREMRVFLFAQVLYEKRLISAFLCVCVFGNTVAFLRYFSIALRV